MTSHYDKKEYEKRIQKGTALKVSTNPGATGTCKGLTISGDLFLGKDNVVEVSIDDGATDLGECIRVSGFMPSVESTIGIKAKRKAVLNYD